MLHDGKDMKSQVSAVSFENAIAGDQERYEKPQVCSC